MKKFLLLLSSFLLLGLVGCSTTRTTESLPTTDYLDLSVREATGTNGAVTCANVYASEAGLKVLSMGGNAFDAAIAMAFTLGVCEPYASGIGGGGVMTAYNAKTGEYIFYDFREFASSGTTMTNYSSETEMKYGAKAVAVPMEVSGLIDIYTDLGSGNVDLNDLTSDAIYMAENGYPVTELLKKNIIFERMQSYGTDEMRNIYGNGKRAVRMGETITNPNYAKALKLIAEKGKDGFYKGEIAEAILKAVNEGGGVMTQADLDLAYTSVQKTTPLHTTYRGYDVYTSNLPAAGGLVILESLNMLENYDLQAIGHNTAEYINLYSQVTQMAYADKRYYVADNRINPATGKSFISVPINGLLSKEYAQDRLSAYNATSAQVNNLYNDFGGKNNADPWDYETVYEKQTYSYGEIEDGGTTSLSVTDKEGNVVTITRTINLYWGSYVMPEGYGFILNNQIGDFTLDENSVNKIEPLKKPLSSMAPTLIAKDNKVVMSVGCPGAQSIPTAILQVILNVIDFDMNIQDAIEAKRTQCLQTQASDESTIVSLSGTMETHKLLTLESTRDAWDQSIINSLKSMNYACNVSGDVTHVYGLIITYDNSGNRISINAGADPRRDGKALAY